ncbi:HAMP domain-containing sensor histidine kinase [Hoeflea sp. CAU 1731]
MNQPSITADKNVLERSRNYRNPRTARAIRETRDRLQSSKLQNPKFSAELLSSYLRTASISTLVMPLLVVLSTAFGVILFDEQRLIGWAAITLAAYAVQAILVKRASSGQPTQREIASRERYLIAVHAVTGICWGAFAYTDCLQCTMNSYVFYKGVVLLIAIAATAMSSFALRRLPLLFFAVPLCVQYLAGSSLTNTIEMSILALLISAFGLFLFVSTRLFGLQLELLSIQSEKDWLIAELETAKSMSDEARRRAEEANLAKSRFLASMSHELRTPLNAILGFSEVMRNEVLGPMENETYKEYASDIFRSGDHLLHLINEILDLSRIEAGRYHLQEDLINLVELASECLHMVDIKARNKDITITRQFERVLPKVWVDEKSMRQVVINLLSNAVKFTPNSGAITLKVGWTAGGGQYVSVTDNGPGIPEEEIPIVLSAFGQGSIAIKSAEQGTGLGLPIVQAILAEHGGQFVLKSKLRHGTEATAILPRNRVQVDTPSIETPDADKIRRRKFA